MKNNWFLRSSFIVLCGLCSGAANAQNTEITITGIKTSKGQIVLKIFTDEKSFDQEKPVKTLTFDKQKLKDNTLVVKCDLAPGIQGISLVDDENKNGEIDKNFVGIPKEGFGFSNFFMEKMKKPTFQDFKTEIKKADNKISIKVKYM
ncbi:DUF2141 domain-containing protein [Dyadobacter crusticola]|uniref:DUF2141 domain-containing protein n=1 Tax=Dyadobacter crusticola TaxID=292407 RepID=UPI000A04EF5E|nr:DUF2141 domain-containing protein [Dyadobacter crusticola]